MWLNLQCRTTLHVEHLTAMLVGYFVHVLDFDVVSVLVREVVVEVGGATLFMCGFLQISQVSLSSCVRRDCLQL